MILCKICKTGNLDGTRYCQGCGRLLKKHVSLFQYFNLKFLAGIGYKDTSIAPIIAMNAEQQSKELGENRKDFKKLVKVVPKEDGSWFCPDCGKLNRPYAMYCTSCGRDFI